MRNLCAHSETSAPSALKISCSSAGSATDAASCAGFDRSSRKDFSLALKHVIGAALRNRRAGRREQRSANMTVSETIQAQPRPLADIPFPVIPAAIAEKWQVIVDTMAELARVPAGLIMRIRDDHLEVMISSKTEGNPYHPGESECYVGSGLYCETVIRNRAELIVPNALLDEDWKDNPDVPRNMISYLGLPILWPDKTPFGTICILDKAGNDYRDVYRRLIQQFRDILE